MRPSMHGDILSMIAQINMTMMPDLVVILYVWLVLDLNCFQNFSEVRELDTFL